MPDWKKVASGIGKAMEKTADYLQKDIDRQKRDFTSKLRTMSDQQIESGLRNISSSDWRFDLVQNEASRRGIF